MGGTMRKTLLGFLMAVFFLNGGGLFGQETKYPATLNLLFNRIQVLCKGGESHSALLAGVTDRGLVIRIEGQDKVIPYDELEKVTLEKTKSGSMYVVSGMIWGLYAGNIIFYHAKSHPPIFMQDFGNRSLWIPNVGFAFVGAGLGFLLGPKLEKGENVFDFTGEENERLKQWERLQKFVTGKERFTPGKFHLAFQGGFVATPTSDRYRSALEENGYYVSRHARVSPSESYEASKFKLLHKAQLTYSLNSWAELGLAMYFLGEPSLSGFRWQNYIPHNFDLSTDIRGYYAVAVFHPFPARVFRGFDWNVGIGLGMADVDFEFISSTYWHATFDPNVERTDDYHLSKRYFSGVVFSELKVYFQNWTSLGITADYVYIPKENIPAFPGVGIPAQSLNLGKGSIGFSVGIHF
jgi:hypothetical protein